MFSVLFVCLSVCNALTFERFDLESSFWYTVRLRYLGISRLRTSIPRSSGQGQLHRSKKACPCNVNPVGGWFALD